MFGTINSILTKIDDLVWGVPLIVMILATGIFLTIRLKGIQVRKLILAFKYMFSNETDGEHGEISSFGALCTALSATIGTGNIVGVATAIVAGGPGALFWMIVAATVGTATKYSECLLAIKYRDIFPRITEKRTSCISFTAVCVRRVLAPAPTGSRSTGCPSSFAFFPARNILSILLL